MSSNLMERVAAQAKQVSQPVAEVTVEFLQSANKHDDLFAVALARTMRAVISGLDHSDKDVLNIVSAPSDLQALLALLQQPAVIRTLKEIDPLAEAKMRGVLRQAELYNAEGGCVSGEEAGLLIALTRQTIDKMRRMKELIALPKGRDSWIYPIWQFADGRPLTGLKDVLNALAIEGPWVQVSFLLSGNKRLQGKRPIDLLRRGTVKPVLEAAYAFGKNGGT